MSDSPGVYIESDRFSVFGFCFDAAVVVALAAVNTHAHVSTVSAIIECNYNTRQTTVSSIPAVGFANKHNKQKST